MKKLLFLIMIVIFVSCEKKITDNDFTESVIYLNNTKTALVVFQDSLQYVFQKPIIFDSLKVHNIPSSTMDIIMSRDGMTRIIKGKVNDYYGIKMQETIGLTIILLVIGIMVLVIFFRGISSK